MGFNNMMYAMHEYQAIINYYKWVALISFLGKKKKKHVGGKRRKEKKNCVFVRPSLELSPFMPCNTGYQPIELT